MTRVVRAAVTETRNAYPDMPKSVDELRSLAGRLDDVRRANVEHHVDLIARAAANGVRLIGLGELFTAPYFSLQELAMWRDLAEDATSGPTVSALCDAAREHGMIVVAPIYEFDPETDQRFNAAVVIDANGAILGRYRKTHIPDGSNEWASFSERFYYEPSDGNFGPMQHNVSGNRFFPVFDTACGRIGVAICYDRHFPGVMASLAAEGAQIVLSPAVTFGSTSRRMWDLEFQVDAMRHNLFVGGSNRRGSEPPFDVEYYGASHFVGPRGVVTPVPVEGEEHLVIADLDLDHLKGDDPSGWNLSRDRRPDIYS